MNKTLASLVLATSIFTGVQRANAFPVSTSYSTGRMEKIVYQPMTEGDYHDFDFLYLGAMMGIAVASAFVGKDESR